MALHYLPEPLGLDMGVDLCRGYVGMTEHLLDSPQISTSGKEVAGKTMT